VKLVEAKSMSSHLCIQASEQHGWILQNHTFPEISIFHGKWAHSASAASQRHRRAASQRHRRASNV
jgi:hypothetical protein